MCQSFLSNFVVQYQKYQKWRYMYTDDHLQKFYFMFRFKISFNCHLGTMTSVLGGVFVNGVHVHSVPLKGNFLFASFKMTRCVVLFLQRRALIDVSSLSARCDRNMLVLSTASLRRYVRGVIGVLSPWQRHKRVCVSNLCDLLTLATWLCSCWPTLLGDVGVIY